MKTLKAFTLLELLIGMILSAIIIGLCYTGNTLIYQRYCNYTAMKREITNAIQLNAILTNDIASAESAEYIDQQLLLNSTNTEALHYYFNENYIVRKRDEIADTFKFKSIEKIEVQHLEAQENKYAELLTELSFDINIHDEIKHFHFTKNYLAETLVNMQLPYLKKY